jgi:3'-phosphoadenosine 5'-phosphosulfate sulfotransferase (PAPS reductase)/FAD synthetase
MLEQGLTVLSYGAGQDSTAILYKIIHDPTFRAKYVKGHLLVLMSDTGNEHPETYDLIKEVDALTLKNNISFVFLTKACGYHGRTWQSLKERYRLNNCIGSKAYPKSCTSNLKINVIYRYIDKYLGSNFCCQYGKKEAIKAYAKVYGKIRVMIGFTKGEENRRADPANDQVWMRNSVERLYPLIDIGYDRGACQEYIKSLGYKVPLPSNCMICPFMSEQELLYLYKFHRSEYDEWIELERNKIEAWKDKCEPNKNFGVWGIKLLPEILNKAIAKYGHWTDEQLREYKMSHGHCVKSKY